MANFTPLDPKPDFSKLEEDILRFWEDNEVFKKTLEKTREGEPFTFYDGPPFATGLPHYGHILASTIKDLIPRYQTMKGRFVRRRWGWDCHGLPIEEVVERELGISGKKQIEEVGIEKFNATCRSMVLKYASEWRKMVRRIARWIDFDHSYKTMDRDYMESVWWAFKQIHDKGLIYEGRKVLMYCPRCETPISNFEVAMDNSYKTLKEESTTVKFRLKPGQKIGNWETSEKSYVLAWTTTPWTLPGNVALAVGEGIEYAEVKNPTPGGEEFYILAKDRMSEVLKNLAPGYEIFEASYKGSDLVGLEYEPLFDIPAVQNDKAFRVYPADFVTTQDGTGVVHTAVVYGEEDYQLGVKVGLPVVPLLDEKGLFNSKAPEFIRGQYFKKAETPIKEDLEKRGLLFSREFYEHAYPHCWRCGTALYYNAIPAWFIRIAPIKDELKATNKDQINWYPDHLKFGRYEKSVMAAPDWNISRNRYWGNPIPVWKCTNEQCQEKIVVGRISDLGLKKNTFLFSRHGQAENNVKLISSCWPEQVSYDLTEAGKQAAVELAGRIKETGAVDMIISSDVYRTKRTAEIVGEQLGVKVEFDPRLREIGLGVYNNRPVSEFNAAVPLDERWTKAAEGGETYAQVLDRLLDFLHETNGKHSGKRILVVSHGDPLWLLQQHFGSELEYPRYASMFELDVSIADLHRPYIDEVVLKCDKCGSEARRVPEIFDSWMEAGSMPFSEFHYPFDNKDVFEKRLPAQFVAEYIAQTRAWFYVMHVISVMLFGKAPFQNVVTTGTILAEDGSKMSKSKRNFPDPWEVINKFGVDSLRFYLMNSVVMQADNLNFSERDLENVYRKIVLIVWNVLNYFVTYANESEWQPGQAGEPTVLDRWISARNKQLVAEVTENLDSYDAVRATRAIEGYVNDLSTWYLRRSRGRKDDAFFATMHASLINLAKVMAPVAPYLSEIVYRGLEGDGLSVHLADWPKTEVTAPEEQTLLREMEAVREAASIGLSIRKANDIPVRQPLSSLAMKLKQNLDLGRESIKILLDELNVKAFDGGVTEPDQASVGKGLSYVDWLYLDLNISEELELEGLTRKLERTVQEMRKKAGLKVGETVNLSYDTKDELIKKAFRQFDRAKTFVSKISEGSSGEITEAVKLDGKDLILGMSKI